MKSSVNNLTKYFLYLFFTFAAITFTSCSNDDDAVATPTGSIEVGDQTISQNQVRVDQVVSSTNGFLVARHTSATGAILAQESIDQGTTQDVVLQLDDQGTGVNLQDGDAIVIALHVDSNRDGNFNENSDTMVATETVIVSSPGFDAEDQAVVDNGMTFRNVSTLEDSFLVAYGEREDGTLDETNILGSVPVQAGQTESVNLNFEEGRAPAAGTRIQTRLHRDVNRDGIFDSATDTPETFGFGTPNQITRTTNVL